MHCGGSTLTGGKHLQPSEKLLLLLIITSCFSPSLVQCPECDVMFSPLSRNKEDDLQYVNSYKPQTEGQQLRILLQGPIGAGKSSFINSVKSVLQNRPCTESPVQSTSHSSCTKKVWSMIVVIRLSRKLFLFSLFKRIHYISYKTVLSCTELKNGYCCQRWLIQQKKVVSASHFTLS